MAEKFKKIDKEFLLTDSTVNTYGFRLLTAGYQKDEYAKNPIGYYMHKRDDGVVVRWQDLRLDGDNVWAKPLINLGNSRGQLTVDEIESGFLNAASVGHFVVLEVSTDPQDMLPHQTGPTVTKWYNRECSLVDIPGNFNALKLFDKDDNEIKLADLAGFNTTKFPMKQIFFTPNQIAAMNLKADADNAAIETAFNALVASAAKVPGLENDLAAANTAKKTADEALTALKATTVSNEVTAILSTALSAKKITVELQTKLAVDYKTNPTGLKALVDAMPAYSPITEKIEAGKSAIIGLAAKSWDELDKEGKLEDLKASDIDVFKAKFKDRFKKDYAG